MTAPRIHADITSRLQDLLIGTNVQWLHQALALLERIGDQVYSEPPPGFAQHRVGAHLRHVLEFYECFLDGVNSGRIDYDARRRDGTVESSRQAAMARIRATIERLANTPAVRSESTIRVRMEDSRDLTGADPYLESSPGRELQVLSSHTIHHFALIAMTLTAHGVPVHPDFGMAPSTLRYAVSLNKRASPVEAAPCAL